MTKCRFSIISMLFNRKKMKCLFNIYYINFAKVYEIKMMLGNEISTSKNVEHGENSAVNAQLNGNLKFNLLAKSGGVEGKIQGRVADLRKLLKPLRLRQQSLLF